MEVCCDPSGNGGTGPDSECTHECEPDCDFSECSISDFYGAIDTRIDPNPACIPSNVDPDGEGRADCSGQDNPVVHYYFNGDTSTHGSQIMTFDPDRNSFTADIPLSEYSEGDSVTWYFVAADNMGNVVAQSPDPDIAPCTGPSSWDTSYETPAIDNCSMMSAYIGISGNNCGVTVEGTPTCFSSDYTINDPESDTCGDMQNPDYVPEDDILGFSMGSGPYEDLSGARVVCAKIKLGAPPPDVGSTSGAIDSYAIIFFNPDIVDPNPNDVHMVNAIGITYEPEIAGSDPNLVRVLWDGDCVTNPNTADPLTCKLIVGGGSEERLKITAVGDELIIIAKNDLPNGDTILGSSSMSTRALAISAKVQMEGDTPFWLTDIVTGIRFVADNQNSTESSAFDYAPPLDVSATCKWPDGTAFTDFCEQNSTIPEKNTCMLSVVPSPDCDITGSYKIYHNTEDSAATATQVGSITENLCSTNNFEYDILADNLNGYPHYFYASSLTGDTETDISRWTKTTCTPEDWQPADAPGSLTCATPAGNENKCMCTWDMDVNLDPSIRGFRVWRDSELLTPAMLPAALGVTAYNYTDTSEELTIGSSYTYGVRAIDAGGNISPETTATCTPEDLKAPEKVDSLAISFVPYPEGIDLAWSASETDTDIAGYNAYVCHEAIPGTSCNNSEDFTKLNSTLITNVLKLPSASMTETFTVEESYCFWIEACDNCDTEGNCPSNGGTPNCSNFDTIKNYKKCLLFYILIDNDFPDYPTNTTASPVAEGASCKLEWDRVCSDSGGDFADCDNPDPVELTGYYIMRAQAAGTDCSSTTVPDNPVTNDPVGTAPVSTTPSFTDTGLTNGTSYCYRVHAYDVYNGFSRDNTPDPVFCMPMDTQAPDMPVIQSMDYTAISCTPAWNDVADSDDIIYTLHRCDDEPASCEAGDFSPLSEATDITELNYDDIVDTSDVFYTYCVTAKDTSQNASPIIDSGLTTAQDSANCGYCIPSADPHPVISVNAAQFSPNPNYGVQVWWTNSDDDDGSGGYNVYLCTASGYSIANCTTIAYMVDGGRTAEYPLSVSDAGVQAGTYYVAVTYYVDDMESRPGFSPMALYIEEKYSDPCEADPVPSSCSITVSVSGAFKRLSLTNNDGTYSATETALTGVEVLVVTDDTDISTAIAKKTVDTNGQIGSFKLMETAISAGTTYDIVAVLPSGTFDSAYETACKNDVDADGYCVIRLKRTSLEADASVAASAKVIPPSASSGGYGGEVGNANGDGSVNLFDLAAIKNSMNTTSSDPCYRQWADFNLDGNINLFDLGILKDHMGEVFDSNATDFDPVLIESKDPLPSECN